MALSVEVKRVLTVVNELTSSVYGDKLVSHIQIDGEIIDFGDVSIVASIEALKESTEGSGEYYIFTCICGYPPDANIVDGITVEHTPNCIRWSIPKWEVREPLADALRSVTFDKGQYIMAVQIATDRVYELCNDDRSLLLDFDQRLCR